MTDNEYLKLAKRDASTGAESVSSAKEINFGYTNTGAFTIKDVYSDLTSTSDGVSVTTTAWVWHTVSST